MWTVRVRVIFVWVPNVIAQHLVCAHFHSGDLAVAVTHRNKISPIRIPRRAPIVHRIHQIHHHRPSNTANSNAQLLYTMTLMMRHLRIHRPKVSDNQMDDNEWNESEPIHFHENSNILIIQLTNSLLIPHGINRQKLSANFHKSSIYDIVCMARLEQS